MKRIRCLLVILITASLELSSTAGLAAPLSKPLFPIVFRVNTPDLGYPGYSSSELNRMADQSDAVWGVNGQQSVAIRCQCERMYLGTFKVQHGGALG